MAGKTGLVTHTELKVLEENQWLDCSVRSSGWGKHSLLYILPQERCEKSLQKRKCMNLIMNSNEDTHAHHMQNINSSFHSCRTKLQQHCCCLQLVQKVSHVWAHVTAIPLPRTPHFTYTQSNTHTHLPVPVLLPNSQAMKCTSHLRSKGISPKSFLWIIEEDQASLTLIILQSICLASPPITSNASDDRFSQSEESVQLEMQSVLFCIVYTDTAWRV